MQYRTLYEYKKKGRNKEENYSWDVSLSSLSRNVENYSPYISWLGSSLGWWWCIFTHCTHTHTHTHVNTLSSLYDPPEIRTPHRRVRNKELLSSLSLPFIYSCAFFSAGFSYIDIRFNSLNKFWSTHKKRNVRNNMKNIKKGHHSYIMQV